MSGDIGRLAIGVVFAVAAYYTGGASYVAFGFAAGSLIGGLIFPPEGGRTEGQRLDDLSLMSSTRGAPMPMLWGSFRVSGNLIDGKKYEVRTEEEQGGKGMGGPTNTTVTWTYFADLAMTLCDCFRTGPITGVRKIWLNNKVFYDNSDTASADTRSASADNAQYFKVYTGTGSQAADPTLEAIHGAGEVPPYAYTAYIVFNHLPLLNYGNAIPQVSCEVVRGGTPDPLAWTARTSSFGTSAIFDVAHNQIDRWVAVGAGGKIASSTDGITWTQQTNPFSSSLNIHGVAFGGGQWIAVGQGQLATSPDGLTWTLRTPPWPQPILCVAYNGSSLWAVGGTSGRLATSPDGIAWTVQTTPFGTSDILCIDYDHLGRWVAGAQDNKIASSTDGITWTPRTSPFATSGDFTRVRFNGSNLWIAIRNTASTADAIASSPDGITWTARTNALGSGALLALGYDHSNLWIAGGVLSYFETSFDGITWSAQNPPFAQNMNGFAISNTGLWVAVGNNGNLSTAATIANFRVTLATIVTDLCAEAGLSTADINVSELTDVVWGYAPPAPFVVADALGALRGGYIFDVIEEDWLLKFPKRGKSSVRTIDKDDLLPLKESDQSFAVTIQQEVDLPALVSVGYFDPALEYEQGNQISRKIVTSSQGTVSVQLPVAMSGDKAAQLSEVLRDNAWVERQRYGFSLPPKHVALSPADVITVTVDGNSHVMRLTKVERGDQGVLNCEAGRDQVSIYTSARVATPSVFEQQVLKSIPSTRLALLDIPILRQADNASGYYAAVSPINTNPWPGAGLLESKDSGSSYALLLAMNTPDALGSATTALAAGPTTIWDEGNSVTVSLIGGATLASDTEVNVLNGANAAALGAEIVQWRTATLNGDGTYTLSRLLRGRRGTEWATGTHAVGDTFVALRPLGVRRLNDTLGELNQSYLFKAVTAGKTLASATAQSFSDSGIGLKPFSPVQLTGTRDGSGNLTITWARRSRGEDAWIDSVDLPALLSPDLDSYDIEILDGVDVVRTFAGVAGTSEVYTSAEQITDFGSNQDPVSIRVFQLSGSVGRGYPGSASV